MAEWKMPYGSGHEGLEVEAFLKVIKKGQMQEAERPGDLGEELEVSVKQKGPSRWGQMRA